MGRCKQLLPLGGKPAIRRCLELLHRGGANGAIVVLGRGGEKIAAAAVGPNVILVSNPDRAADMASSIRVGICALPHSASAALICLSDMPLIDPATICALLAAHRDRPRAIIVPLHGNRRGHPVLLPRELIQRFHPNMTLRDLLQRYSALIESVAVADAGTRLDMDTPADYNRLRALCQTGPSDE